MGDLEKYLAEYDEKAPSGDIGEVVLRYVAKLKKLAMFLPKVDFYTYFYISCIDDFDPRVEIMAMTYKDLNSFTMPKILHGRNLIPFIESILQEYPNIADEFVKEMTASQEVSPETKELLKRLYIFKEIVKHELIHYVNMHLPRIMEFFRKKGFVTLPRDILEAANIEADSICNIYLDKKIVEKGGLIPPLPHEVQLEELLAKIDPKNPKKHQQQQQQGGSGQQQQQQGGSGQPQEGEDEQQGQGAPQGGKGKQQGKDRQKGEGKGKGEGEEIGEEEGKSKGGKGKSGKGKSDKGEGQRPNFAEEYGQYRDLLPEEVEEIEKHNVEEIKDIIKKVLENAIEEYKGHTHGVGTVPSELEETIKWLSKRKVKYRFVGQGDIYGIFKHLQQTYTVYNPKNENPYKYIFPSYRPLTGAKLVVIVDTSASMDQGRLSYALDLVNHVVSHAETYLVEIDAKIQKVSKVSRVKNEFTFKGRGGTEFDDLERLPQFIHNAGEVKTCIILTDGRVYSFPKTNPLPRAKWIGITTDIIPDNSPSWIQWMRVEDVIEGAESNK